MAKAPVKSLSKSSSKSSSKSPLKSKKATSPAVKKASKKTLKVIKAKPVAGKASAKASSKPKAKAKKTASDSGTVYKLNEGDQMPSFKGESTSGQTLSSKDFKGRAIVLYFYPKDNTPGCTLEGQDFKRLHAKFEASGAEIIGVSKDSIASHERFKDKCGFPFELLSDESGEVCKGFDVIQMKSLYGRKFEGIERSTFLISPDGKVAKAWRKVKVAGHAEAVLDAVRSIVASGETA